MLMDRHKYEQLLRDEIQSKHLMADEGFQYEVQEREEKRAASTSIKDGMKKLFFSGLLVFGCILVSILTFVCFTQGRNRKSGINREAELAAIRRQQQQQVFKQKIWKNINGLSQVDEEGESYVTAHSDYRRGSAHFAGQELQSIVEPGKADFDMKKQVKNA